MAALMAVLTQCTGKSHIPNLDSIAFSRWSIPNKPLKHPNKQLTRSVGIIVYEPVSRTRQHCGKQRNSTNTLHR
jgi:hypothetical protein